MKIISTKNYIKNKTAQFGVGGNLPPGVSESDPNFYSEDTEQGVVTSVIYRDNQEYYMQVGYGIVGNVIDETSLDYRELKDKMGNIIDEDPILSDDEDASIMEDIQTDAVSKGLISEPGF